MDSSVNRYLAYAAGELLLVVLGILIALQINNWNEERKEKQQLAGYARALAEDLKADIGMLEVVQSTARRVVDSAGELTEYMWQRDIKDVDTLRLAYQMTFISYRPYSWNLSALKQLTSSGALSNLNNADLVRMISKYEATSRHLDEDY